MIEQAAGAVIQRTLAAPLPVPEPHLPIEVAETGDRDEIDAVARGRIAHREQRGDHREMQRAARLLEIDDVGSGAPGQLEFVHSVLWHAQYTAASPRPTEVAARPTEPADRAISAAFMAKSAQPRSPAAVMIVVGITTTGSWSPFIAVPEAHMQGKSLKTRYVLTVLVVGILLTGVRGAGAVFRGAAHARHRRRSSTVAARGRDHRGPARAYRSRDDRDDHRGRPHRSGTAHRAASAQRRARDAGPRGRARPDARGADPHDDLARLPRDTAQQHGRCGAGGLGGRSHPHHQCRRAAAVRPHTRRARGGRLRLADRTGAPGGVQRRENPRGAR